MGKAQFVQERRTALRILFGASSLSRPRKELYRELVVGPTSNSFSWRGAWAAEEIPLYLGARMELLEQLQILAHLVTYTECVTPSEIQLQSRPGRHARLFLFRHWFGRNGWARLLLLRASSPVLGSHWGADGSHRTQAARAARRWLRYGQRSSFVSGEEAYGVSRDPSCSSDGDLYETNEGIVWRCKIFSSWSGFVF